MTISNVSLAVAKRSSSSKISDFTNLHDAPFAAANRYRVVLDAFGNLSLDGVKRALTTDGVYVTTVPSARIVRNELPCSPCFERTCPLGHTDCLNRLMPERVLAELSR